MTENRQLGTRISTELYEELRKLSEKEHVSLNTLIVEAIRDLLRKYARRRT
jgi:predicted HicB family RNase H-like nuclease